MLRNKDRKLAGKTQVQSRAIADATAETDTNAQALLSAAYDFNAWAGSLTDEELIERIPKLTERIDYICHLAAGVQKDTAEVIGRIWDIRITLDKLSTHAKNREKEEGGEC